MTIDYVPSAAIREELRATLEALDFEAFEGAHVEGQFAAYEIISTPKGQDACNLVFSIRPYARTEDVPSIVSSEVRQALEKAGRLFLRILKCRPTRLVSNQGNALSSNGLPSGNIAGSFASLIQSP